MSSSMLHYEDLAGVLSSLGYADEASGYHGALCGALCRQKPEEIDPVELLDEEEVQPDGAAVAELRRLCEQAVFALADMQTGFMPLLPEDDVSLAERARALGAWCEGFLYGLAGRIELELRECSDEVREIIKDFTQFTRASLESGDDLEVEEGAYAELVEYIRVGAQLIYMELHPRPPAAVAHSTTLH
ncbi:MAG: UPF0149 family protein [Nevskia sp.]|nr:UPF0149 family protein [Nevskia sp.]